MILYIFGPEAFPESRDARPTSTQLGRNATEADFIGAASRARPRVRLEQLGLGRLQLAVEPERGDPVEALAVTHAV
jgi:hypothetical protein